ncbi:MAG: sodium:proton exchanger [Candidatus Pacebacteria bacterium CG10_big_fil_rev_8_21_14_0_10_44_11]|nr:MAG: sodium:proton exchanger [Candidatus Pacebacteria bacterium CG10_big_fil_rev_8_21_14_0_10_44_11]
MTLFVELTLVLLIVAVASSLMKLLKQPLIVGYILAGVIVGPVGFNVVQAKDTLELFSKIGIAILLFIVGLHLSPKVIKEVGAVSMITGISQVLFTSVVGFLIALALGLTTTAAWYVAIALTFSSTIVVLKLISDKGRTHSLYGKIAIGFLLVQDVIASVILIGISAFSNPSHNDLIPLISLLVLKTLGLMVVLFITYQWLLPKLSFLIGKSQELLFVFSLAWGLGLAALFQWLGLSIEIGALVAGVAMSTTTYAEEIAAKLRPLRDFFIILFFVVLGSSMTFSSLSHLLLPVLVLSSFVLVGNPVIMIVIMNLLGFHKRTSFMTGLSIAQISEFSLILASLGLQLGHLSPDVVTIITLVGLVTIAGSTYLILYSEKLYPKLEKLLSLLELRKNGSDPKMSKEHIEIFLFGCDRTSDHFLKLGKRYGYELGIVDFNPAMQERYEKEKVRFFYGDVGNKEFLLELPLDHAKLVISSIPTQADNILLCQHLKEVRPTCSVLIFAQTRDEAEELYTAGASYVILPHEHAAASIVRHIGRSGLSNAGFSKLRLGMGY